MKSTKERLIEKVQQQDLRVSNLTLTEQNIVFSGARMEGHFKLGYDKEGQLIITKDTRFRTA